MPIINVRTDVDQFYRRAIVEIAPAANVRFQFRQALANGPMINGRDHAERWFGESFADVVGRAAQVCDWLDIQLRARDRDMKRRFGLDQAVPLPGLIAWMDATGFGNDYRVLKAFALWSEHELKTAAKN